MQRSIILLALLLLTYCCPVLSQVNQDIGVFHYDSNFYIGGHDIDNVDLAKELHMTFTQQYARDLDGILANMRTAYTGVVDSNWANTTEMFNYEGWVFKRLYDTALSKGFKIIVLPQQLDYPVLGAALSLEHYYDYHLSVQPLPFMLHSTDTNKINFDTRNLLRGTKIIAHDTLTMIAGDPERTFRNLQAGDAGYYVGDTDRSKQFYIGVAIKAEPPVPKT